MGRGERNTKAKPILSLIFILAQRFLLFLHRGSFSERGKLHRRCCWRSTYRVMLYYHSVSDFAPGAIKKNETKPRDGYNFCIRYKLVGGCLHCARKRKVYQQSSADSNSPVSRFVISRAERQCKLLHFLPS
jgi:hypothetical protein